PATYFPHYHHTARALNAVSPRLLSNRAGPDHSACAAAFIHYNIANKNPADLNGTQKAIPRDSLVFRAVKKVHDQISASPMPGLPLFWTEFNASYMNEPEVTDSAYMGPWMADTIRQCDGLVNEMSYWTFSDVFEEQGVVKQPFYGGFGLIAARGIPKPAY